MKVSATLERHYVLPCCLLLLNLCNEIIAYKARLIGDPMLRTRFIMDRELPSLNPGTLEVPTRAGQVRRPH